MSCSKCIWAQYLRNVWKLVDLKIYRKAMAFDEYFKKKSVCSLPWTNQNLGHSAYRHNISAKFINQLNSPQNKIVIALWFWKKKWLSKYCPFCNYIVFNPTYITLGQNVNRFTIKMIGIMSQSSAITGQIILVNQKLFPFWS